MVDGDPEPLEGYQVNQIVHSAQKNKPYLRTALLDRLADYAHVLVFQGESYQFKEGHNRKTGKLQKSP